MKTNQFLTLLITIFLNSSYIHQDPIIEIVDEKLYEYCLGQIDKNKDGFIQKCEASSLKSIRLERAELSGLEYLSEFENLEDVHFLRC